MERRENRDPEFRAVVSVVVVAVGLRGGVQDVASAEAVGSGEQRGRGIWDGAAE
jgi:hypothetical protein